MEGRRTELKFVEMEVRELELVGASHKYRSLVGGGYGTDPVSSDS